MALLEYWHDWPPYGELMRGYVGYKPLSKEERKRKEKAAAQAAQRTLGPAANYEHLPAYIRDALAANKAKQ